MIEYSSIQGIHSTFNITFKELLDYVWARIMKHQNQNEILKILEQEIHDSKDKCFTGKITRLVNCLNGFYDDISVNISEKEQIGNIIVSIKNRLNPHNPNFIEIWKEQVAKELRERSYNEDEIKIWIEQIE